MCLSNRTSVGGVPSAPVDNRDVFDLCICLQDEMMSDSEVVQCGIVKESKTGGNLSHTRGTAEAAVLQQTSGDTPFKSSQKAGI